jgi:hypothetical protein
MNIAQLNRSSEIESLAASVLRTLGFSAPPIDVLAIASTEGILLAEDDYGPKFFGRIEYHPAVRKFILYHPLLSAGSPNYWQTRFSIAHELGHYYIPEHRQLLLRGKDHSSEPGFLCDNKMEREADLFASCLLIPASAIKHLWTSNQLSIQRILKVAENCQTSAIAAGIRAARGSEETAIVVISQHSKILFAAASDEAKARHFGWISRTTVPPNSPSAKAIADMIGNEIHEASMSCTKWFDGPVDGVGCWEEARRLGRTSLVLTLLVIDDEEDEDD